jgi:hypothetical protein
MSWGKNPFAVEINNNNMSTKNIYANLTVR